MKDLKGQRFAKLTVMNFSHAKKNKYYWMCQCDCGNKKSVRSDLLIAGHTKSCGCYHPYENLTGQTFGLLSPIEPHSTKYGLYWACECKNCGEKTSMPKHDVKKGKACRNCLGKPKGHAGMMKLFNHYKDSASKRGYLFNLTQDEFQKLTRGNCHYCGISPKQIHNTADRETWATYIYNGIDRVNNEIGYCLVNCVSCCKICNMAKRDMTYHDFIAYIKRLKNAPEIQEKQILFV